MLAAVPSIVYGFWGLFVLAPVLQALITALGGSNQGASASCLRVCFSQS